MSFVSTDQGHIAFAQITKWERDDRGVRLELADGGIRRTDEPRWETAINCNFTAVLPAQPGTFFLTPCGDGDETIWQKEPVIGWGVRIDGILRPIGHEGTEYEEAVLHPNGLVTKTGGSYENEAAYIAFYERR
jgi:hypothetical protein